MPGDPAPQLDAPLRALADGNRRGILHIVRSGPQPVGAIAERAGLSQQTTSHHLGVLRDAGLVQRTRQGTRHLFAVRTDALSALRRYLDDFRPERLAALEGAVEARASQTDDHG